MQGFNKYYPPDYDPDKHKSLNSYHGKHALGDRARKIDKGILITRFELPFNIWCGTCNNHIGMGVRYNAEKRKVGNYYSTPIFAFRCKCHLCDGWFEIRTDPKNTRYVVEYGARQKVEEWDPAENGGFAVHENDPSKAGPSDPLIALEKATEAIDYSLKVQAPRLESIQSLSDHYNSDPYALSSKLRRKFREEKKIDKRKREEEAAVRDRYALPSDLQLVAEDDVREEASLEWKKARIEREMKEQARNKPGTESPVLAITSSQSLAGYRTLASGHLSLPKASSSRPDKSRQVESLKSTLLRNTSRSTQVRTDVKDGPNLVNLGVIVKGK